MISSLVCISQTSLQLEISITPLHTFTYKDDIGKDADTMVRFDSTIVALSTKLLKVGYLLKGGDAEKYRQLKISVEHEGGIP